MSSQSVSSSSSVLPSSINIQSSSDPGEGSFKHYWDCSTRIFIYLWALAKVVLGLSYCCTLLSFLIQPLKQTPLTTVKELRDAVVSGQYQFGTFGGTSLLANLMDEEEGVLKDLADHIRKHPKNILGEFEKAMERVKKEKFAVQIMKLHFMIKASRIGLHDFYVPSDTIGFNLVSIAFRKDFPLMEEVNMVIHRMVESGLYVKKVQDLFFKAKLKGPLPEPTNAHRPLSIFDVYMLFLVLVTGLMLSTCCLILEVVYNKYWTSL
nr:uncharacterized protein LOC110283458 [Parasteatoda tepidariorum]